MALAVLLAACATTATSQIVAATSPSSEQIMQACVEVETPKVLKQIGLRIKDREEAEIAVHFTCQVLTRICADQPASDDCQKALVRLGMGDPNHVPSPDAALYNASEHGATAVVRDLLAGGANPDWQNAIGWTPLMIAAAERHPDTVIVLLDAKVNPNLRNRLGRTALMFAASYGQDTIVERLLAAGADPNIVAGDATGWTALVAAASAGHTSTVESLLRGGANPAIKSKQGETPLDIARGKGHAEVIRILQRSGNQ
jgi:ankyrin repeat protein